MALRPYQQEALDGIHLQLAKNASTLAVLPTGTGKTHIVGHLAIDYLPKGRIMMLGERDIVVRQAYRHLKHITKTEPAVEMGQECAEWSTDQFGFVTGSGPAEIVVGTIQTQISGKRGEERMRKFHPDEFALLIIDEAHHSAAPSYRRVIEYYQRNKNLKVVGITATPDRLDKSALGQVFESVAFEYELVDAIDDGWLVPIEQQSVFVEGLDYSTVGTTAGDLNGADLARVLEFEEILHEFVSPIIDLVGDKKTLIFAKTCIQAERITEILNRHRLGCAEWVHGGTPKEDREILWPRYANGDFQFLTNVGITVESWDEPTVEVIAMCRPTISRLRFAQMLGRGTRALAGIVDGPPTPQERKDAIAASAKPAITILDFVGNAGKHRLITPSDILGGIYNNTVMELANTIAAEESARTRKPVDVAEALVKAEQRAMILEREKAEREHRKALTIEATYSTAKINPFGVLSVKPDRMRSWNEGRDATDKQLALLEKWGVDVKGLKFTHASQLIDTLIKNRDKNLPTYKMMKRLQQNGFDPKMPFVKAKIVMDALAKNYWRPLNPEKKNEVLAAIA